LWPHLWRSVSFDLGLRPRDLRSHLLRLRSISHHGRLLLANASLSALLLLGRATYLLRRDDLLPRGFALGLLLLSH